jgi:ABC-type transport system involved in cytochrome c biogenesis permease subunit
MRICAWRIPLKNFYVIAFAVALGLGSFAAVKDSYHHVNTSAIPVPLCPPDAPSCDIGGN